MVDHRRRVLPRECPRRRLEVQTLLVALVVVGAATGQLLELLLLVLVLLQLVRELLTDGATSADAAAASTTTDATTFKLCLDVNSGGGMRGENYTMSACNFARPECG